MGADNIAPPGVGSKPINAGGITIATLLSLMSFSSEPTITSRLPLAFINRPIPNIKKTATTNCMVFGSLTAFHIEAAI